MKATTPLSGGSVQEQQLNGFETVAMNTAWILFRPGLLLPPRWRGAWNRFAYRFVYLMFREKIRESILRAMMDDLISAAFESLNEMAAEGTVDVGAAPASLAAALTENVPRGWVLGNEVARLEARAALWSEHQR